MIRLPFTLLLAFPLVAQASFRATRHAFLPPIFTGDKYAVGDVDGDGDIDIVVANDNSSNQLLLNDGRARFVDATDGRLVRPPGFIATHGVDLVDIDGDGDLDILLSNDDFLSNRVYVNDGAGFFKDRTATALPPNFEFTQNQVVGDFDGDGDADWFTVDQRVCHLYSNDGSGVFTDASAQFLHNLPTNLGARYQIAGGADVDGDGDLDVMVPDSTGRPFLILNQGGGHLWPAPTQPPTLPGTSFTFHWFVDIDNDGDPDLVVDRGRLLLQNQGNGIFVDVTATAFPGGQTNTFAVFDVDGDGDVDRITAQDLWLNDGTGRFTRLAGLGSPQLTGRQLSMHAADFDGDGDLDAMPFMNFTRQVDAVAAPTRGAMFAVDFYTRSGATSTVAACAALQAARVPVGSLGVLRLDAASFVTLSVQNVTTSPMTLTLGVPNASVFAGVELHWQALIVDPATGPHLSNAIREVVQ